MLLRARRIGLPAVDPMSSVQREMEQLFGRFLNGVPENGHSYQGWHTPLAMWDDADKVYLDIELPGVKTEDVDLTVHKQVLRVAAERKQPEENRNYTVNNRSYGRFERSLNLPDDVDAENIDAQLTDGILHIVLSKKSEAQPKKITIKG